MRQPAQLSQQEGGQGYKGDACNCGKLARGRYDAGPGRGAHRVEVGQLLDVVVGGQAGLALLAMRQQPGLAQLLGNAVLQAGVGGDVEPAQAPAGSAARLISLAYSELNGAKHGP